MSQVGVVGQWWTLTAAVCWIVLGRSAASLPEIEQLDLYRLSIAREWIVSEGQSALSIGDAEATLVGALQSGRLLAKGERVGSQAFEPIPEDAWADGVCEIDGLLQMARRWNERAVRQVSDYWTRIRVPAEQVVGLTPSLSPLPACPKEGNEKSTGSGGGRPPKYDLVRIRSAALDWLSENGAPSLGDGHKAAFERKIADLLPNGSDASASTLRRIATTLIAEYRISLETVQK